MIASARETSASARARPSPRAELDLARARPGELRRRAEHGAEPIRERAERSHLLERPGAATRAGAAPTSSATGSLLVAHDGDGRDAALLEPQRERPHLGPAHLDRVEGLEAQDALGLAVRELDEPLRQLALLGCA